MEYTTNYHLPQWAEEDRILMEDFNEAMANIDKNAAEIKLLERTVAKSVKEVDFDFSEIDLSKFSEIHFRLNGVLECTTEGTFYLYFNDSRTEVIFRNSGGYEPGYHIAYLGGPSVERMGFGSSTTLVSLPGGMLLASTVDVVRDSTSILASHSTGSGGTNKLALTDVQKMTFAPPGTFQAGFRFVITGVPK